VIGRAVRALVGLAVRPLATEIPPMLGRRCPGCGHVLDYNCREVYGLGSLQGVRCATKYCGLVSVWEWADADGAVLLWTQSDERVSA
jgi:hypothetical protein